MAGRIDFNCDLGEGCGDDAAIVPLLSSASIACGGHAGDAGSMRATLMLCDAHGVAAGAHPSYLDRAHFGRRKLDVPADVIARQVREQIEVLAGVAARLGVRLAHVKPHGALYNRAARDGEVAAAVAGAVREIDPGLLLYALSGSQLANAGVAADLHVVHEVFAERRYEADATLTPRSHANAVITSLDASLQQVRSLLRDACVIARTGERVPLRADSLCLHGDRADAAAFAHALREALLAEDIEIAAPGRPDSQHS